MDGGSVVEIRVVGAMAEIAEADWDACAAPEAADGGRPKYPFLTHRFLAALEESGSATARTGWAPHHLVASVDDRVAGVMPLYLKSHSQGEYVFDHAWAHAFERAGGDYYPKLQASVPFTPATGPRLLARPDGPVPPETARAALLQGAVQLAGRHGISSVHVTFCTDDEWRFAGEAGFLQRTDQQFHWLNRGYDSFDAFLDALASRKRKNLRKERAEAISAGVEIEWISGADLRTEHWDAFWRFYQDTGARKWGRPYLTREFFRLAHERFPDEILLVMARRGGRWIAGALNLIGRETLFGRYWGCVEERPCLHFEVCYYQAIDYAIRHRMARVEAGAQGAHKLARGYEPVTTRSLHWITDPGFRRAVAQYLESERDAVEWENAALAERAPFRKGGNAR
ncbi:MAG TPA: GNAT family N-acetyltransferase [Paracoccaceae bacterium]|nr:GNAT family N-acetyltransferase [Paracoccaceae bacterium]